MSIVILPLAFRISLPALNNNLVNLIKTTTIAYAIAVPEMLYVANQIWSDELNVPEMMNMLLIIYVGLVGVLVCAMARWERAMRIPGYAPVMIAGRTDLPVLHAVPARARARPAPGGRAAGTALALVVGARRSRSASATRSPRPACPSILATLVKWTPLLATASLLNIAMSFIAMAIGTALGTLLGLMQISLFRPVRGFSWAMTQFFRNAPWLVLLVLLHAAAALRDADRATRSCRCRPGSRRPSACRCR